MIKFLIGVFVFLFVIPFMIFSLWAYFDDKKNAKNRKQPSPLTHAQMMALLEPDGLKSLQRQSAAARPETKPAAEAKPAAETK